MQIKSLISKLVVLLSVLGVAYVSIWQYGMNVSSASEETDNAQLSNFDIRTVGTTDALAKISGHQNDSGETLESIERRTKSLARAERKLREKIAGIKIEYGMALRRPEVISPESVGSPDYLTDEDSTDRAETLRRFIKDNSDLFGLNERQIDALKLSADYQNPNGKLSFVHFEQKAGQIPVFQGELKAGFSKGGAIIRIINNLAPDLSYENLSTDFGDPREAVVDAGKAIGTDLDPVGLKNIGSSDLKTTFTGKPFTDQITAEKIYFPISAGVAMPAWRVLLWQHSAAYYVVVDARDGTLFWRKGITETQTQTATYNVYGGSTSFLKTHDSPAPFTPGCINPNICPQPPIISRQNFTLIGNEPPYTFNTNGWIPDGENRTIGNAAEAGIDRDGTQGVDPNGWAFGNPNRDFIYTYNPAPGNPPPGEDPVPTPQTYPPSAFQQGSITSAFYAINRWHDEMYLLGFTEPAFNFQTDNFGRGGSGNDSISVEVQDGSGTNSANFSTPADGGRPRLQLFIWTASTPRRDGALDSQVAIHEVTHGLSSRLHGNALGLLSNMSRGMGEGWSDFYSLALLSDPADDPLGIYSTGCYSTAGLVNCYYGIRRFPTARISVIGPNGLPHNPLTFRYINSDCNTLIGTTATNPNSAFPRGPIGVMTCDQVHNIGEVWSAALWEVRGFLIDTHGAAEGNRRALQYITDGMKLAPLSPTLLQERDAILAAAQASNSADVSQVWRGFAARGMGFSASIQNPGSGANNTQVTEAFDAPNVLVGAGFAFSDSQGNNNGYPEPGEPLRLTVPLVNNSGATITGVNLQIAGGGSTSFGDIPHGQIVSRDINYTVPVNAPCPGDFLITFNITGSAGPNVDTRTIFLGVPVGGPPVTFSNSTQIDLPGGQPATTSGPGSPYPSQIQVAGLTGNKKIKLEVTGITHTFPADLDFLLVGPGGQKYIFLSDSGGSGDANNLTFSLNDEAVVQPSTTQWAMGEFRPYNAGANDTFAVPAPSGPYSNAAPAGADTFLSVFGANSANLNGNWDLYAVDDASGDFGLMTGWKLTFESNEYICIVCRACFLNSPADFDGDGKTDLSVYRPSEGNWYLNRSTAGFSVINWGVASDRLAPGDYDGDGKTDTAVFRPNADSNLPDFYILNSSSFTFSGYSWGLPGDIPNIGDFDGDGRDDIGVFRPSNHTFYILKSQTGSVLTYSNIQSGTPVTGDFDGDGKGDFATYNVDGWFLAPSNTNYGTFNFTNWGSSGDKPVAADYDGDGRTDFAVFRPSNQTWYILKSSGGSTIVQFGLAGDVPVPGDYDGDGRADIAVYRDGTWYIIRSTAGMQISQFGLGGDLAIPNAYFP